MATSALAFATDDEPNQVTQTRTHTATQARRETHTQTPPVRLPRKAPPRKAERPDAAEVARVFGAEQLADLRRMAMRLGGQAVDPDDLLHDALERALASFDRFERGTNLHAWMRTIMYRLVVDRSRSRRRRKARMEIERWAAPRATPPADEIEPPPPWAGLDLEDVRDATAALSEPLKRTFTLYAIEGLSYDEVAERLGIPAQTVGTRLLRAKLKLRTVLAEPRVSVPAARVTPLSFVARPVPPCRTTPQLAA